VRSDRFDPVDAARRGLRAELTTDEVRVHAEELLRDPD
jgi:hypothetical protein